MVQLLDVLPNGVIQINEQWQVPSISNNVAKVEVVEGEVVVVMSQRSLVDAERRELTLQITQLVEDLDGRICCDSEYPGWAPVTNSTLQSVAEELFIHDYGFAPKISLIHAGLECGIISGINPCLQMLSLGPNMSAVHSIYESLSISSTQRVYAYLKRLLTQLQGI